MRTLDRLSQLVDNTGLDLRPELYVKFESERPVSEKILETAEKLGADLIVMGLHDSAHNGLISRLDLATTYDVVCQASSPVLTLHRSSGCDLRPRPTKVTASPGGLGTHSFRHTYGSWLDAVGTALTVQQKLMRRNDIQTTLNIYGDVVTTEMQEASSKVAGLALKTDFQVISAAVSY